MRLAARNSDSHYLLGRYYHDRGRHKEAAEEYRKVLSIDPKHITAYNALGICYDLLGKFPEAAGAYRAALRLNADLDYLHNNLGYSLLLQGDADGAVTSFRKAISLNSRESRFHNNLGMAYGQKGEYELAFAEFKLAGDEPKAHFNLAQVYFGKGLYGQAKEQYARALFLNPSLTIARAGAEAAGALASVFQPSQQKASPDALAAPEVVAKIHIPPAEPGNPVRSQRRDTNQEIPTTDTRKTTEAAFATAAPQSSPPSLTSQSLSAPPSHARGEGVSGSKLVTVHPETQNTFPPWTREAEGGGDKKPKLNDFFSQSPTLPPTRPIEAREESGLPYKVRVASFSSYKIALREMRDLQRSGLQANLMSWTDRKGNQWHTVTAGPWATREEALGCKSKLEKGGKFKVVIEQEAVKGPSHTISAQNSNGIQKSLTRQREAGIEISNGNGINGMAARVRTYLQQKGLKVVRLTNADNFTYSKTNIFYQRGFTL